MQLSYFFLGHMTRFVKVRQFVPGGAVDNTVVCEETSRTVHRHIREVVYVLEEQDRSQNGALGDTRNYRFRVRWCPFQNSPLRPVGEEV